MANGKPGDHPLTDYLSYGKPTLPAPVAALVDQIVAIDSAAFHERYEPDTFADGTWDKYIERNGDWFAWERGEKLDEAVAFLQQRLAEVKARRAPGS